MTMVWMTGVRDQTDREKKLMKQTVSSIEAILLLVIGQSEFETN